jgi:hypothetical protein
MTAMCVIASPAPSRPITPPQELPTTEAFGILERIAEAILSSLWPMTAFTIHSPPSSGSLSPYIIAIHSSTARELSAIRTLAELNFNI